MMDKATSIGIIGGADGPTAIYLTSSIGGFGWAILGGLLVVAGVVLYFIIKKIAKIDKNN